MEIHDGQREQLCHCAIVVDNAEALTLATMFRQATMTQQTIATTNVDLANHAPPEAFIRLGLPSDRATSPASAAP